MPKKSTIKNRNVYLDSREALDLTRAAASEMTGISEGRIEKIESGKIYPYPEDVLAMAEAYRAPALTNHYCSADCPIGRKFIPEVADKSLPEIVLSMLSLLRALDSSKERLIDISADGEIEEAELKDFVRIQKELDEIAANAESLKLWISRKVLDGAIDEKRLEELRSSPE